ncbi:MAG: ribbon-helix-helix protein, CopG family [Clostridia bacterium]|nr:ribbon-helix-helix protein, CopG family [Clostridia bacterium]
MAAKLVPESIRMTKEQWAACREMAKVMRLRSKNEFIRDAVDFYIEWCRQPQSQRFLTTALESVIEAKVRDSENRIARMLFKLAVELNVNTHIAALDYNLTEREFYNLYAKSVAEVKKNNGEIDLEKLLEQSEEERNSWLD